MSFCPRPLSLYVARVFGARVRGRDAAAALSTTTHKAPTQTRSCVLVWIGSDTKARPEKIVGVIFFRLGQGTWWSSTRLVHVPTRFGRQR